MFRAVVTRAARRPVITASTRLSRTYPLRWNSSQPPQASSQPPQANASLQPPQADDLSQPPQANASSQPPQDDDLSQPSQASEFLQPPQDDDLSQPSQASASSQPPQANASSQPPQASEFLQRLQAKAALSRRQKTPEELAKKARLEKMDDLQRDWDAKLVSYEELLPKTQSPSPLSYLIDVREPQEVMQGMIPSAVNLPLSALGKALQTHHEKFKNLYGFDKPKLDQEIIFYCRTGKRSASACDVAKRNGYTNIFNFEGSWFEWLEKQNVAFRK